MHAELYKWITVVFNQKRQAQSPEGETQENYFSWELWLRLNQFFGYSVSLVSLYAVIWLLVEVLAGNGRGNQDPSDMERTTSWSEFKAEFKWRHGMLWLLALVTTLPIVTMATELQTFG